MKSLNISEKEGKILPLLENSIQRLISFEPPGSPNLYDNISNYLEILKNRQNIADWENLEVYQCVNPGKAGYKCRVSARIRLRGRWSALEVISY